MELEEDLLDNGLLDCTRVNPTPVFYQETTEQLNKLNYFNMIKFMFMLKFINILYFVYFV